MLKPFVHLILTGMAYVSGEYHHLHDIYPDFYIGIFAAVYLSQCQALRDKK